MSLSVAGIKGVLAEPIASWKRAKKEARRWSNGWCTANTMIQELSDLQRDLLRAAKENR